MTFRKIHIKDKEWHYYIGKSFITIYNSEKKKYLTHKNEVSGRSWNDMERDEYPITPSMVRKYIEKIS